MTRVGKLGLLAGWWLASLASAAYVPVASPLFLGRLVKEAGIRAD